MGYLKEKIHIFHKKKNSDAAIVKYSSIDVFNYKYLTLTQTHLFREIKKKKIQISLLLLYSSTTL